MVTFKKCGSGLCDIRFYGQQGQTLPLTSCKIFLSCYLFMPLLIHLGLKMRIFHLADPKPQPSWHRRSKLCIIQLGFPNLIPFRLGMEVTKRNMQGEYINQYMKHCQREGPIKPCTLFILFFFYWTRVRSLLTFVSNWTSDSFLFSRLHWCDPGVQRCQLKTCRGFTVADVDDEDLVGNSLLHI